MSVLCARALVDTGVNDQLQLAQKNADATLAEGISDSSKPQLSLIQYMLIFPLPRLSLSLNSWPLRHCIGHTSNARRHSSRVV